MVVNNKILLPLVFVMHNKKMKWKAYGRLLIFIVLGFVFVWSVATLPYTPFPVCLIGAYLSSNGTNQYSQFKHFKRKYDELLILAIGNRQF